MKKEEFDEKIEKAAAKVEDKIEQSAARFDSAVTRAAHTRLGKIMISLINIIVTIALLVGGSVLMYYGHLAWAIVCFVCGGLALIWRVIEAIVFASDKQRRK